jgi:putative membrane protein
MKIFEKSHYTLAVVFILHAVGVAGFNSEWKDYFQLLTPLNLLISIIALLLFQEGKNALFWITAVGIYVAGFGVEWLGVKTGQIFGVYEYGATLGLKLDGIPLMIGVNWLMLALVSAGVTSRMPLPWFMKAIVAAALMVFLDFLIEPVAMAFDMWNWDGMVIPIQNYIAWYVIALMMLLVYFYLPFGKSNKVAAGLYLILFGFFTLLNFTL